MQVILLDYPGIEGEISIEHFDNWISIDSIEMHSGGGAGSIGIPRKGDHASSPPAGSPSGLAPGSAFTGQTATKGVGIDSLTLHKSVDSATPSLMRELMREDDDDGEEIEATIVVLRAHERQASSNSGQTAWHEPFLEITLGNAHVTGHNLAIGKDNLTESITLGFDSLDITYTKYINGKRVGVITETIKLED